MKELEYEGIDKGYHKYKFLNPRLPRGVDSADDVRGDANGRVWEPQYHGCSMYGAAAIILAREVAQTYSGEGHAARGTGIAARRNREKLLSSVGTLG